MGTSEQSPLQPAASGLFVVPRAQNLRHPTVGKNNCQEGRDARVEQDGDERMVGHWKPYATLLAFGLIPKAGIATELLPRSVPSQRQ
jgi:hypothetical protein